MTRTAIVVGAGIAGLASAIALRRAGYDVTLIEQAPELAAAGAALSLWPNAIAGLRVLGASVRIERDAAPITSMHLSDQHGRPILSHAFTPDANARAFLPTRSLLQTTLLDAVGDVTILLGTKVASVAQDAEHASLTLDDGRMIAADLVIAADGIWSATATLLIGNPPRYLGYGGVLALARSGKRPAGGEAREFWGSGERFGLFDVTGGHYWFYIRDQPADAAAPTLAEVASRVAGFPAAVAAMVNATEPDVLLPFSVHARPAPRRLGRGRIICVGDAAHAMEPNLGQGGCQGIEDAVALGAVAMRVPPEGVLAAFEALRLKRIRSFVRRSRQGALGAHGPAPLRLAWRTILRATPAVINRQVIDAMHQLPDYL